MSLLGSLRAWTNPEWPSTPTYGALARFGARRSGLVTVLAVAGQLAVLLPMGHYGVVAMIVGAVLAAAIGYFGGVAVAFGDHGRATFAAIVSAGVLAATGATMRALDPETDLVVGIVAFAAFAPLAVGVAGYTFAERAMWRAED